MTTVIMGPNIRVGDRFLSFLGGVVQVYSVEDGIAHAYLIRWYHDPAWPWVLALAAVEATAWLVGFALAPLAS